MFWSLTFDPLLPVWLLLLGAFFAALLSGVQMRHRLVPGLLRGGGFALLLLALANPSLMTEERMPLKTVVALVADRSGSQDVGERQAQVDAAVKALEERLARLPTLDVRRITVGTRPAGEGTELFKELTAALADVPPDRLAGVIAVTDGIVHDVPSNLEEAGFQAPFHALITGHGAEIDRRLTLLSQPTFGLVGSSESVRLRIEDAGKAAGDGPVKITLRREGTVEASLYAGVGEDVDFPFPILHGGENIFEFEIDPVAGELSTLNNKAAVAVKGIRENLRVLLVSGEPHAGERTWRNLLKSDASVDLIHFTILRPPEKQDGTPINELSLIAFPTRELFATKIDQFDLIIFDRYQERGVLPLIYFDNIARFISEGGAVLIAAGPDRAGGGSIYRTPLAPRLPALPTGAMIEAPFHPMISVLGTRHPVTRGLEGGANDPPLWSRWFRLIDAEVMRGETIMEGEGGKPLLVLSREGEGRVAMLLSDHIWLWARGFEGGGPHGPLLRRLAHWLMKEPDLEEEALRLIADQGDLLIERQTLKERAGPVTLTLPSGKQEVFALKAEEPGLFRARLASAPLGLYTAEDGVFKALAHMGPTDRREARNFISTPDLLKTIAEATEGSVRRLQETESDALKIPRILPLAHGASYAGRDWIGLKEGRAYEVTGRGVFRLLTGFLGLGAFLILLSLLWWREGRT